MLEKPSISAEILRHESEFLRDKDAMAVDRRTLKRMMKAYTGFDHGGYNDIDKYALLEEGNRLPQFNVIKPKVRNMVGNAIKDFLDKDFVPVSGIETPWARTLKGMYLSDKNHFEYDRSYAECLLLGYIHMGIEYMYIDTKFNPVGNIAFKTLNPANVIIDPHWKSNKSSDIQVIWTAKYLTAKQIRDIYGHSSSRIDQLIKQQYLHGLMHSVQDDTVMPYQNIDTAYDDLHRLVEKHYIEVEGKDLELIVLDKEEEPIQLPSQDYETNKEFLDRHFPNKSIKSNLKRRIFKKVYKVRTSCATLDPQSFIEDREAEIQIQRLPFFVFSAQRLNGRNQGVVEDVIDAQEQLDKREQLATNIIESSAHGSQLVDPMLFGTDMALARQAIADFNKPDAKIFTAPGALAGNQALIREIPKTGYQGEIYNDIQRMRGWIEQITGQTASLDGTKESAHDTGVLMQQRIVQSNISQAFVTKRAEDHELEKTEAWLEAAKQLYKDDVREFVPGDNKNGFKEGEVIKVNERVYTEEGVEYNYSIDKLPPFKVVVKQSRQGLTVREYDRSVSIDALGVLESPLKRNVVESTLVSTLSDSEEQREKLQRISDLELEFGIEELNNRMLQMRMNSMQMQQQLQASQIANQQAAAGQAQAQPGQAQVQEAQPEVQPQQQ